MIWSSKSTQSVSGVWVITSLTLFTAFLIYGYVQDSVPMKVQGWFRVGFSLPITLGFFIYGKVEKKLLSLCGAYGIILCCMWSDRFAPAIFITLSYVGVWSSFVQAYTIWKNKSRGQVSLHLQIIYFLSSVFWLVYAAIRKDYPLVSTSIGFTIPACGAIILWCKYPRIESSQNN